jgi:hypothetical protein
LKLSETLPDRADLLGFKGSSQHLTIGELRWRTTRADDQTVRYVLVSIREDAQGWEARVPPEVADVVMRRGFFGAVRSAGSS